MAPRSMSDSLIQTKPGRIHRPSPPVGVATLVVLIVFWLASGCASQRAVLDQQAAQIDSLNAEVSTLHAKHALLASEQASLRQETGLLRGRMRELADNVDSTQALLQATLAQQAETLTRVVAHLSDSLRHAYVLQFQRGLELNRLLRGRTIDVVYFPAGSTQLPPAATQRLDRVAAQVRQLSSGQRILVEGHADDTAFLTAQPHLNNRVLSAERAAAVVRYFVEQHGFSAARFEAAGFGTDLPLVPNEAAEGRQINRRVRIAAMDPL
jgi:outer membrane protein OmpA-like peptidoglycan-associated protein